MNQTSFNCPECKIIYSLTDSRDGFKRVLGEELTCPGCNRNLQISSDTEYLKGQGYRILHVTSEEFRKAINGFGLPEEQVSDDLIVKAMFLAFPIKDADITLSDTKRVVINTLTLSNGVTFYFTGSGSGAIIYKMLS